MNIQELKKQSSEQLISQAEELGVDPSVMKGAWEKNTEIRSHLDWYDIPGAVSKD